MLQAPPQVLRASAPAGGDRDCLRLVINEGLGYRNFNAFSGPVDRPVQSRLQGMTLTEYRRDGLASRTPLDWKDDSFEIGQSGGEFG
jgi:hypothetical protein